MSRTLDTLLDAEHGTVDGYRAGCRGSHCPAGEEHGLSCVLANTYAAGNWNYMKALRRGLTPAEIAAELGLHPTGEKPTPKPKKTTHDEHELDHIEQPKKEPTMTAEPKPSQSEIRAWARDVGLIVPARGTLPRSVVEAFNARGKGIQASDVKPTPAPEPEPQQEEPVAIAVVEPEPMPAETPELIEPTPTAAAEVPDWSLPLAADDLRSIADAIDALERVPRAVIDLDRVPVLRPGGDEVIGEIITAADFDDDPWFGFVPRGGAA